MKVVFACLALIVVFPLVFISCQQEINFEKDRQSPSNSNTLASFTLLGAPGACMSDTVIGNYMEGIELDSGSYVKLGVNVVVPGRYTIFTNTVNGYRFSDSGTFTVKGPQTIRLSSKGSPLHSGTDLFTVPAGASSCGFSVPVLPVVVTANNDLFPLTTSSFWIYDDSVSPGTKVKATVIDSITINGKLYKIIKQQSSAPSPQLSRYRKSGSDYFEYVQVDQYTSSVRYNKLIYDDLPFLKESVFAGNTWTSK